MLIKKVIHYYRPYIGLTVLDFSTAVLHSAFSLGIPFLTYSLVKNDIGSGSTDNLWWKLGGIVGLIGLFALTAFINAKWGHILGTRIESDMRQELFRHLQKLSFSYYDKTKTGHLVSRIANDLFNISELAHHGPEDFIISLTTLVGAGYMMFQFNHLLAVIALAPMALMFCWGLFYGTRMRKGFRKVRKRVADINSNVENSIQGIREVKSFANEDYQNSKFDEVNAEFRTAKEDVYTMMATFFSGMLFLMESYQFVVIAGGVILARNGQITLAEILGFLMYMRLVMMPIHKLVNFIEQFQQGAAALERFTEVMDIQPDIVDRPEATTPEKVDGEILVENLTFSYESSAEPVLKDVSMTIPSGKTVALVGESGAGKSTLATLIPRFYEAQEGRILIDGNDVRDLKQKFLRENVGIVQQNVFMFDSTIRENILFGRPDATEEEILEAARRANILDFINSLPEGLDSMVGEHGVMLSGGQKQRLSIARVFLKNPPVLIFDEATSSLDTESEMLIKSSMEELSQGRTTVIIAHRLSTVRNADMTYVLRGGKLVESGTHEELLKQRGYYSELYENSIF